MVTIGHNVNTVHLSFEMFMGKSLIDNKVNAFDYSLFYLQKHI